MYKEQNKLHFATKASLLSVLGDQLVSSELIAIKELVINSYDADATEVKINFLRDSLGNIYKVILEDNGQGMSEDVIRNAWFIAATDNKTSFKKVSKSIYHKRPIMGEKGVGRFACMKIGKELNVISKPARFCKQLEYSIDWKPFLRFNSDKKLEDIEVDLKGVQNNEVFVINETSGLILEISDLNTNIDDVFIKNLKEELSKLVPPYFEQNKSFNIYLDDVLIENHLFLSKALYYMEGIIDNIGNLYYKVGTFPRPHNFEVNSFCKDIDFNLDIKLQLEKKGMDYNCVNLLELITPQVLEWKKYIQSFEKRDEHPQAGNFKVLFFSWDKDAINMRRVGLDNIDKKILNIYHGVSIYRDNFRVWPYGVDGNDWLELDKKAEGSRLPLNISNKQIVGYVELSQEFNPYLKDQSNREGFIKKDYCYEDFKRLTELALSIMEWYRYRDKEKRKLTSSKDWWTVDEFIKELDKFEKKISVKNEDFKEDILKLKNAYSKRKDETETKIKDLLDISTTGIVYESVTHELISFLLKMDEKSKEIQTCLEDDPPRINDGIEANVLLYKSLEIIFHEIKDLQPYFKAARVNRETLDVKVVCEKAYKFFKLKIKRENIVFEIEEISHMNIKAVEGFLLQVLSNLIDNSIYWLQYNKTKEKRIKVIIDGNANCFYFLDSGIGIDDEKATHIFKPFYTQKNGGRGLGLYICKELLSYYRGDIEVTKQYTLDNCNGDFGASFKIIIPKEI